MAGQAGDRTIHIHGYNFGVAGTEVDVRSDDADLTYNTSAQSIEIVSGDVNDDFIPTGTLTLVSAVANTFATGTCTLSSVAATDTCTINGLIYLAVSGTASEGEFDIDGDDTADAVALKNAINADTRSGTSGDISATNSSAVVTVTTDVSGTGGNAITLTSQDAQITVSGSGTLTSGVTADSCVVNGLTFTGVAGTKSDTTEFSIDTSDTAAALDLKLSINARTTTPVTVPLISVTATSASGVVTVNALTGGADGNTIDISGTSNITASGATLADIDAAGSWTVLVKGLDSSYAEVSETINLNGQIANAITQTMIFVESAEVATGGTDGDNQGTITVRIAGGGATQITIAIGESRSSTCNYIVPAGFNAEITSVSYGLSNDITVINSNRLNLFIKSGDTDSQWFLRDTYAPSYIDQTRTYPSGGIELGPKAKINFKDTRVTGGIDNIVHVTYTIVLHQA